MSVPLDIGPIEERNANELLLLAVTDRRVLLAEVDRLRAGLQHIADDPGRPDMTTEPLDPAAIMAEHCSDGTDEDGGPGCVECSGAGWADPWPCLPYRLAAEVDRLQRQHQGQAEHITLLRTAVDRLTAALIERDAQIAAVLAEVGQMGMALGAARVRLAGLGDAVKDLCWKATPFGETEDGDVHTYIVPKGTMHRLIGAAQSAGIPATFRAAHGGAEDE